MSAVNTNQFLEGLETQFGFIPTDFIDAIMPFLTQSLASQVSSQGNIQSGLNAQTSAASQQQAAATSAQAQIGAANIGAQATIGSATISAQGGIQQQLIQAEQRLIQLRAEIERDIKLANAGDKNAAFRLEAELKLEAQIANQATRAQFTLGLLEAAGKTGLRDALTSRRFARGLGGQALFGSALGGLTLDDLVGQVDTDNPVDFFEIINDIDVGSLNPDDFQLDPFELDTPNFNFNSGFSGGGGVAAPIDFQEFELQFGEEQTLAELTDQNRARLRGLAGGGTIHRGNQGIVGEEGPEIINVNPDGSVDIIPMDLPQFAHGGTLEPTGAPSATSSVFEELFNDPNTSISQTTPAPAQVGAASQSGQDPNVLIPGGGNEAGTQSFDSGTGAQIFPTEPPDVAPGDILGTLGEATATTETGVDLLNNPGISQFITGQVGGFGAPIRGDIGLPEEGIAGLPDPFQRASTFIQLPRQDQEDVIELYILAGFTREDFWARIFEALPGNRGPLASLQQGAGPIGF